MGDTKLGARPPVELTLFSCLLASQASILVVSPLLPQIAQDLGVGSGTVGQLRAISGVVAGVGALVVHRLGRRTCIRRLLLAGCLLLALAAVAGAAAPNFALLALAQVPAGLGIAIVLTGAVAASAEWAGPGEKRRALSWALAGQPVAWVVGMPVVGSLAASGWRLPWAVFPVVTALAAFAAVSAQPGGRRLMRAATAAPGPGALLRTLRMDAGWAVGEVLAFSAWSGALVYAGAVFASYGAGTGAVGVLLGGGAAAYLPGNFLARRWIRGSARRPVAALAACLAAAVFAFLAVRPSAVVSTALFCTLAAIAGARTLAGGALGLELQPSAALTASGIRSAANQFGYLIGGGLGGSALAAGGFEAFALGAAACALLAAVPHIAAALKDTAAIEDACQGGASQAREVLPASAEPSSPSNEGPPAHPGGGVALSAGMSKRSS
jgi:predicted MFS family arabinose efflux permease